MANLMRTMENQVIRDQLLQLLREAGPNGASRKVINLALKKSGFQAEEQQVTEALHYLKMKGLVWVADTTNNALGIHMDVYVITPDGIDTLEGTREEPGIGVGDV